MPDNARYKNLLELPEENDIAAAIKDAMVAIEKFKPELAGILPQDEYFRLTRSDSSISKTLLKNFSTKPKVLIQDWYKDSQSQQRVRATVEDVLDKNLPASYDRMTFKQKCDRVYEVVYEYSEQGRKWAA